MGNNEMGLLEVLTIIFVVLKLTGVIAWSWWLVLSPMIVAIVAYGLFVVSVFGFQLKVFKDAKKFDKHFK